MSESRLLDRYMKKAGQIERLWNPRSMEFESERTPSLFKQAQSAAAGAFVIWTPSSNKRIRLLGGLITFSKDAACAGAEYLTITDNIATNQILRVDISTGALVATGNVIVIPFDLGKNGYLATYEGNILYGTLNGALTAGTVSVNVWGCEE